MSSASSLLAKKFGLNLYAPISSKLASLRANGTFSRPSIPKSLFLQENKTENFTKNKQASGVQRDSLSRWDQRDEFAIGFVMDKLNKASNSLKAHLFALPSVGTLKKSFASWQKGIFDPALLNALNRKIQPQNSLETNSKAANTPESGQAKKANVIFNTLENMFYTIAGRHKKDEKPSILRNSFFAPTP